MTPEEKAAARAARKTAADAAAAAKAASPVSGGEDWNEPEPASEFDAPVRVRCIVHTRPFTDKKALNHEEEADVSAEVAEIMLKRKQVELV